MKSLLLIFILLLPLSVLAQTDEERMVQQLVKDTKIVVLAEVVSIGPTPNVWSGLLLSVQRVRYKVLEVLKGELNEQEIDVGHYIVKNSLTANSSHPRLSSQLFVKGNKLILFLVTDPGKGYIGEQPRQRARGVGKATFLVPDSNYGAMLANETTLNLIRHDASAK